MTDLWEYAVFQAPRGNFPTRNGMHFPENSVLRPRLELSDTGILKRFGFLESV